jgi:hypothetical protein
MEPHESLPKNKRLELDNQARREKRAPDATLAREYPGILPIGRRGRAAIRTLQKWVRLVVFP